MNILITGCRRGIGKSLGVSLATKHKVYMTTHKEEDVENLTNEVGHNNNIEIFKLDITNKEDVEKIKQLDIDILVNNGALNISGSVLDISIQELRNIYETNVFSQLKLMQIALEQMKNKNEAQIINISSLAGVIPLKFLGVYGSTKSALSSLTRNFRKEAKLINKNIRIKLIEIGAYHTGFNQDMANNNTSIKETSYFHSERNKQIENLHKFFIKQEVKNINKLTKKLAKIINRNSNKFRYRMPFIQSIGGKLFEIFLK